jgi:hypothetical protein
MAVVSDGDLAVEGPDVGFGNADLELLWKSMTGVPRAWNVVRADESSSSYKQVPQSAECPAEIRSSQTVHFS